MGLYYNIYSLFFGEQMFVMRDLKSFKNLVIIFALILIVLAVIPSLIINLKFKSTYIDIMLPITSSIVAILLFYTAGHAYKNDRPAFMSWFLIGIGISIFAFVNVYNFIQEDIVRLISLPNYGGYFYLLVYPFLIGGALLFLNKPIKVNIKSMMDIIIVMISAFFIVWFIFIWPTVGPSQPDAISDILSISYLLFDLVLLNVLLILLFNKNRKIPQLPIVLFSIGVFLQIFGDMIYSYYIVNPGLIYEWIFSFLYSSNSIFVIFAIICYLKGINVDMTKYSKLYRKTRERNVWISYLPLILVLSAYSILLFKPLEPALIFGVGIIVVLVVLREIISLNEITAAQRTLKRNKILISKREEQLDFITSNMMDLITETDENGFYKYVSASSGQLLGYSPDQLMKMSFFQLVHPDDLKILNLNLKKSARNYESVRMKYRAKNTQYDYIWLETIGKPVFKDSILKGFIFSSRDITEQKKSEEIIKNSLIEKQTLLREIHHRVNNNFQIISSLLNLQSINVVDPLDQDLFIQSKNRVKSMAMVHEKLYQTEDLSSINFPDYLKTLINSLINESDQMHDIDVEMNIDDIELNLETSIPCGLIINEIVSNSIKHAFPDDTKGKIKVDMYKDDGYVLIIGDNGLGNLKQQDLDNSKSLGLSLIKSLVEQLEGKIKILEDEGTFYKITFDEMKYKDRI